MPNIPRPRRLVWLAVLCAAQLATSASLPNTLFERDVSCAADFTKCGQAGLPDFFCCSQNSVCNVLAANTTVLCCQQGNDCTNIQPISCDVSLQDGQKNPTAGIKTTVFNVPLAHCGSGLCCPFGYTCNSSNLCVKSADQDTAPSASGTPTSSSSLTATSGPEKSTSTSNTNNAASSAADPQGADGTATSTPTPPTVGSTESNSGPQPGVVAGAVVGSIFAALIVAVLALLCLKKRRAEQKDDGDIAKSIRSTSSFGNIISHPIMTNNGTMRSDFARRSPGVRSSNSSSFATQVNQDLERIAGDIGGARGSPPTTPTRTPRTQGSEGVKVPPIRNMRQSSIAYGYGAPNTSPYNNGSNIHGHKPYHEPVSPVEATGPAPQTPKGREPSSMTIPLYTDERTLGRSAGGNSNYLELPGRRHSRDTTYTTFSDMLKQVALDDVAKGREPFVPPGAYSPATRR
ncbi:hypothetical protein GQ53DRAFT_824172 [Thozetella sp. PMI_491]|nr:hypothetical protein GQ53DRAFT_824172 [Thozetella sp. PMI_491]